MSSKTKIQRFFDGKSIFLTGGTGFLGSLLIEKLLRCCTDVKIIFVLIRHKWNASSEKRFNELFNSPIYENLKKNASSQLKKIVLVNGDLEADRLGLSDNDWNTIVEEVNYVFHIGASVKFNDPLRDILKTNVFGTNEVVLLTKEIKNLECFIHVSSTYAQCNKKTVEETTYESPIAGEDMLIIAKHLGEKLDEIESMFVDKFPNTYTFTKFLAEDLVRRKTHGMPVGIVRPSIVSQTWKDPLPGWADPFHSLSRCMSCYSLGVVHVLPTRPNSVLDVIPADFVINNIIAAAWEVGTSCDITRNEIKVYNCATSHQNPVTAYDYERFGSKYDDEFPSNQKVWTRFVILNPSRILQIFFYYFHLPQMIFFDAVSVFLGRRRKYLKLYQKLYYRISVVSYFIQNSWLFKTENTTKLWCKLEDRDKEMFNFDITSLDWDSVIRTFIQGTRIYILKEKPNTITKAHIKRHFLKALHYISILGFGYFVFWTAKLSLRLGNLLF